MRWLIDRVRAAWLALHAIPYRPTRVGVLNTGELVMIDGLGQSTVFSTETTGLMRSALIDTEPHSSELLVGLPGFGLPDARTFSGLAVEPAGAGCTD